MQDILILTTMLACALLPFVGCARLMYQGFAGYAVTLLSVLGAAFAILLYGTNHDVGLDPVQAMGMALLFCLPALAGGLAGSLLGHILRKHRL